MTEQIHNWPIAKTYEDLQVHIRLRPYDAISEKCYVVDFEVFDLDEYSLKFQKKNSTYSPNPVDTADEAEPLITGSVKWDGCSHSNFGRAGYIHGCSRKEMVRLGTIYNHLFDLAGGLIGQDIGDYLQ